MKHTPRLLLLGYGNVAQAFMPLLAARMAWMEQELAVRPLLSGIGTRRTGFFVHASGLSVEQFSGATDPFALLCTTGTASEHASAFLQAGRAAGANTLIELTTLNPHSGEPALGHIRQALASGMDVITANKGPLAHAGEELHTLARQHGVHLRYESTVMDGLPVLNLAEWTLPAVGMRGFRGLLNRTSSIVLAAIEQGRSQEEAIRLAQQAGVAEANPWHDLDGWDATMKTTILATTLLHSNLTPAQVQRTGIRDLSANEIRAAALHGTPIRLVSSAHLVDGVLTATVCPRRLLPDDPLFAGRENGVLSLDTEAMGPMTLIQHATGVLQTAYGVLSDLVMIQRARSLRQSS
jgi:homoserine dehydrogenase